MVGWWGFLPEYHTAEVCLSPDRVNPRGLAFQDFPFRNRIFNRRVRRERRDGKQTMKVAHETHVTERSDKSSRTKAGVSQGVAQASVPVFFRVVSDRQAGTPAATLQSSSGYPVAGRPHSCGSCV